MDKKKYISQEIERLNLLMRNPFAGKSHPPIIYSSTLSGHYFYFILQVDKKAKPTLIGVNAWQHCHHDDFFTLTPHGIDEIVANEILKSILGTSVFEDSSGIRFDPENLNKVLGLLKPFEITEAIN